MPYVHVESLEEFWKRLCAAAAELLESVEPDYVSRFRTCQELGLTPTQTQAGCNALLSGKFEQVVALMESLHEVRYYWKRLTEAERLLHSAPSKIEPPLSEGEWLVYHLDFWWHSMYGLLDRLRTFLVRLDRRQKLPKDSDTRLHIRFQTSVLECLYQHTATVRDPIAHKHGQGIQGWRDDHTWESYLVLGSESEMVTIYDDNHFQNRDFYLDYISKWTSDMHLTLNDLFGGLLVRDVLATLQ